MTLTLEAAIAALEQQPDIPAYLTALGCRLPQSYHFRSRSCPVAQYIQKTTGAAEVSASVAWLWADSSPGDIPTPPRIARFISEFDDGAYPDLMESPS